MLQSIIPSKPDDKPRFRTLRRPKPRARVNLEEQLDELLQKREEERRQSEREILDTKNDDDQVSELPIRPRKNSTHRSFRAVAKLAQHFSFRELETRFEEKTFCNEGFRVSTRVFKQLAVPISEPEVEIPIAEKVDEIKTQERVENNPFAVERRYRKEKKKAKAKKKIILKKPLMYVDPFFKDLSDDESTSRTKDSTAIHGLCYSNDRTSVDIIYTDCALGPLRLANLVALLEKATVPVHRVHLNQTKVSNIGQLVRANPFNAVTELRLQNIGLNGTNSRYIADWIERNVSGLKVLDLSSNNLMDSELSAILRALHNCRSVIDINLSSNRLKFSTESLEMLLLGSSQLERVNLSWNFIGSDGFAKLSRIIATHSSITHLNLASTFCTKEHKTPAVFVELFSSNQTLIELDLSNNQITEKAAVVLLESLLNESTMIKRLELNDNPLGPGGASWIIRYLAEKNQNERCSFGLHGCNFKTYDPSGPALNPMDNCAAGSYTIHSQDPYDRVVLKTLIRIGQENSLSPNLDLNETNRVIKLQLSPTYSMRVKKPLCDNAFESILMLLRTIKHNEALKQLVYSIVGEYALTFDQVRVVMLLFDDFESRSDRIQVGCMLLPKVIDIPNVDTSCTMLLHTLLNQGIVSTPFFDSLEKKIVYNKNPILRAIGFNHLSLREEKICAFHLSKWLAFNFTNPTGHYRLFLNNPIDRGIFHQLKHLSRTVGLDKDATQLGDGTIFRNVLHDGIFFNDQELPLEGKLEFDIVTPLSHPEKLIVLSTNAFCRFVDEFDVFCRQYPWVDCLQQLRTTAGSFAFQTDQMMKLMMIFPYQGLPSGSRNVQRMDVFIAMYGRIVDLENVYQAWRLLDTRDRCLVMKRIGPMNLINLQNDPTGTYCLDLTLHDEYYLAQQLKPLALHENLLSQSVVEMNDDELHQMQQDLKTKSVAKKKKLPKQGYYHVIVKLNESN